MHRLARQARPALRAIRAARSVHTEVRSSARTREWLAYAAGGVAVGAVLAFGSYKFDPDYEARHAAQQPAHASSDGAIVDALHNAAAHADDDDHSSVDGEEGEGGVPRAAPYNPDTGEFNWDCPCLGGLPDSVCGEQFKASFKCFVLSEAEPKGMDCIDAFNAMQTCFREHPEVYSREIDIYDEIDKEDEELAKEAAAEGETSLAGSVVSAKSTSDDGPVSSPPTSDEGTVASPSAHGKPPQGASAVEAPSQKAAAPTPKDSRK